MRVRIPTRWSRRLKKRLHIEIFGRQYDLQGDTDQEYAFRLAAYVDQKMHEISEQSKGSPYSKLLVLAAINIAHELFQLRDHQKEQDAIIGGKTLGLIESIEAQFSAMDLKKDTFS